MRKKYISKMIIIILMVIFVNIGTSISVAAENSHILSHGNLVMEEGEKAAIYAEDIQYLQKELDLLFEEIGND